MDKEKFNNKNDKVKKCKHCNGIGLIQIAPNVRGLKKCPFCNGISHREGLSR